MDCDEKHFFSCLVSAVLFLACAIILENKSDALGIKLLILQVHLPIQRSSGNIDPQKIVDCILLENCGMQTIKDGHLSLLSKNFVKNINALSSILMSRSKNEA